jgi:uncharacterized protein YkwD
VLSLGNATAALALGACLLTSAACAPGPGSEHPSATSTASSTANRDPLVYAAQMVRETNAVRHTRGLGELAASPCARDAALRRAADLIGKPELTHAALADVIATCTPASTAAENLSRADASPAVVVAAWMSSPGHRSNLLDPALTQIGVACLPDRGKILCSQVFLGP